MENNVDDSKLLTLKEVHISKEEFDQKYKIYKKHFEDSLENPEYTNIAITGDYGIGKSTIFKSFLKNNDKYKDKYVEVIIGNYENQKDDLATTVLLEKQIINQLVSQIDSKKIPLSKYKLSFGEVKWKSIVWMLLGLFFWVMLIVGINRFWSELPNVGQRDWLKFLIIGLLSSLPIVSLLLLKIQNIVNYFHKIILKFKIANLEVKMEINKLSEFDNNLAELIYIFSNCEKNIFVFEDLDRFGNNLIFQKLRELNLIVNKYLQINDKYTNDKKISFIYLVKPDLFEKPDDFLKFFDISVPIIPIVNNFDSINYFKQIFGENHWDNNWNFRLLVRSTYKLFNSVREIHNLHNEFIIYWEQNKNEHYSDYTSVLSFLILKNKFPETFKKLLNHQSELFQENVKKPLIIIQHRNEILNKLNNWFENIWAILEENLTQNEKTNKILRYSVFSSLWYNSPNDRKLYCTECGHSYNFYEFYNYCIYMQDPSESKKFLNSNLEKDDKYNNYVKDVYNENDFFKLLENQGTNIASFLKYGSLEKIEKIKERFSFPWPEKHIKQQFQNNIQYLGINSKIFQSFDNYEYDSVSLIFAISKILNEQKEDEFNLNKLIKCIFERNSSWWRNDEIFEYYRVLIKLFWLVDNEVKIKFIKEILNWKNLEQMIDTLDNDSLFNFFSCIYDSRFSPKALTLDPILKIKNEDRVKINELWQKIQKERKMESCSHPYINIINY